jgi:hypothetical protein
MKIELDRLNTTESQLIFQKIAMKISEIQRQKAVRTIRSFYNQRQVQFIVDLKKNPNSQWLFLTKTVLLMHHQQTNAKIDLIIQIVAWISGSTASNILDAIHSNIVIASIEFYLHLMDKLDKIYRRLNNRIFSEKVPCRRIVISSLLDHCYSCS